MSHRTVVVRIEESVIEALRPEAIRRARPVGYLIGEIVREHLKRKPPASEPARDGGREKKTG